MPTLALLSTIVCLAVNAYTYRIAYPLWRHTTPEDFPTIHTAYLSLLTPIITLPHIAMFFANAYLALEPPPWLPRPQAAAIFILTTSVILLSAFVAGPIHDRFQRSATLGPPGLERLIHLSAIRTLLMAAATTIFLLHLTRALPTAPPSTVKPQNRLNSTLQTGSSWRIYPIQSATIKVEAI